MEYKPLSEAIENADHTIMQACVEIDTSTKTLMDLKIRGEWPKNKHICKAIVKYIRKYNKEGVKK